MKRKTTAIIYTRFSPRRNAEECESGATQQAYCEQYAHDNGYVVGDVHHDEAVSGSDADRPNLWAAVAELGRGDVLLVYKRDRLARDVYLAECIRRAVKIQGATIEAVTGDVEGDGAEQVMVRQVIAAFSEYERKAIAKRTSHAMLEHQRRGRRMSRHAPYGWRIDPRNPKRMEAVESEVVAVERIKALHAEGVGPYVIAGKLNAEMPGTARSGKWNHKTIYKILGRM